MLQSEMLSLRVDNSRLNQLVSRGHVAPPTERNNNNRETSSAIHASNDGTNQPQRHVVLASTDQSHAVLEDLSFHPAAKSLGMNNTNWCSNS